MSSPSRIHRTRRPGPWWSVTLLGLILAACGSGAASSADESTEASSAASASLEASEAAGPSAAASEAAAPCLPAEVIAAIDELRAGNFEPDVPLAEIAEAVEGVDVSGMDDPSFAELLRDDLVEKLANPDDTGGIGRAAAGFVSEVLPEVEEC
jgi:hypothetical protein